LYRKSLLLSGIAASLERCGEARVVFFGAPSPAAGERLRGLQPDVVVFDITTGSPVCAIRLWQARADLLLIGVDLSKYQALVIFWPAAANFFESTRQRKSHPEKCSCGRTLCRSLPGLIHTKGGSISSHGAETSHALCLRRG
jgi:hypothetical protein